MTDLAPPELDARARLTDDQAQELVLRILSTQSESLLRTAHRHSLCADDAHDAYQRGVEIFLRRARRLDPASADRWLHVVVKHEAMEVRRARVASVGYEEADFERAASPHAPSPEEQVLGADRTRRATEALKRLKPQELRAMWLKATGHSYAEIGAVTGYSATKVNRSLTEGRKAFLDRFEGIESGRECERWQPVLAAMADGSATAAQITDARPHLRNCPACRAQLRPVQRRPLSALLPVGLLGTIGRFVDRLLPGGELAAVGPGAGAAGAAGGAKLAALLASGAIATAGGGFVMAQETAHRDAPRAAAKTMRKATAPAASASHAVTQPSSTAAAAAGSWTAREPRTTAAAFPVRHRRVTARRSRSPQGRVEFTPHGDSEPTPAPRAATTASAPQPIRHASATVTPPATPTPDPTPSTADSTHGEFSPQP